MLSKKIESLKGFLSLYDKGGLSACEVALMQNFLSDIHAQALRLEQAMIAPAQKITPEQVTGNIVFLPLIPMPGRW